MSSWPCCSGFSGRPSRRLVCRRLDSQEPDSPPPAVRVNRFIPHEDILRQWHTNCASCPHYAQLPAHLHGTHPVRHFAPEKLSIRGAKVEPRKTIGEVHWHNLLSLFSTVRPAKRKSGATQMLTLRPFLSNKNPHDCGSACENGRK
jgi:hypothetical protein